MLIYIQSIESIAYLFGFAMTLIIFGLIGLVALINAPTYSQTVKEGHNAKPKNTWPLWVVLFILLIPIIGGIFQSSYLDKSSSVSESKNDYITIHSGFEQNTVSGLTTVEVFAQYSDGTDGFDVTLNNVLGDIANMTGNSAQPSGIFLGSQELVFNEAGHAERTYTPIPIKIGLINIPFGWECTDMRIYNTLIEDTTYSYHKITCKLE